MVLQLQFGLLFGLQSQKRLDPSPFNQPTQISRISARGTVRLRHAINYAFSKAITLSICRSHRMITIPQTHVSETIRTASYSEKALQATATPEPQKFETWVLKISTTREKMNQPLGQQVGQQVHLMNVTLVEKPNQISEQGVKL